MHRLAKSFTLIAFILVFVGYVDAQTHVSGGILPDNTTWTAPNSPYIIDGNVTVGTDSSLTIEPGVTVQFSAGTSMMVNGLLTADGSAGSQITFTSNAGTPAPGDWGEIEFSSSTDPMTVLNNCVLEYGGGGTRNAILFYASGAPPIDITNSTVQYSSGNGMTNRTSQMQIYSSDFSNNSAWGIYGDVLLASGTLINNSSFENNATGGLRIPINSLLTVDSVVVNGNGTGIYVGNGATPQISNSSITSNTNGVVTESNADPTFRNCNFSNNTNYGINHPGPNHIDARWNYWGDFNGPTNAHYNPAGNGDRITDYVDFEPFTATTIINQITQISSNITTSTTWDSGVYVINNNIDLESGNTLTVDPGVIVKFKSGVQLRIYGTLHAVGRADSQVVFTSYNDDSYGGDTNGDGNNGAPSPGYWRTLRFESSASNSVLRNAIVKFAGGSYSDGNLELTSGATPVIDSCYISRSADHGIDINNTTNGLVTSTYISGNQNHGVNLDGSSEFTFTDCVFEGNGGNGIYADDGSSLDTLMNNQFIGNGSNGAQDDRATVVQYISGNIFSGNSGYGLLNVNSLSSDPSTVVIDNNTFENNGSDGLLTSAATITNNTITGNNYPISITGILGNIYGDPNSATDDNQISGNRYDNAIGLRSFADISGHLTTVFPATVASGVYVVAGGNPRVNSGTTLQIDPGTIVKFESDRLLRIDGTLLSRGTSSDPIVYTSWRDSTFGGKTNDASDMNAPSPGDWREIYLNSGDANGSRVNHVVMRYGGGTYSDGMLRLNNVASDTTFSSIDIKYSGHSGIYMYNSAAIFSNCVVDSNNQSAISINGNSSDVRVTSSFIRDNGRANGTHAALYADDGSTFREISNNMILRNDGTGIYSDFGNQPHSIIANTIEENTQDGIYIVTGNAVQTDGVQISGNVIRNNGRDGVVSSGAHFVENQFIGNRYPIAVTGRLGNDYTDQNGNDENTFINNIYNNAIAIRNNVDLYDTLSYDFPDSIDSHTYVVVDGDPRVDNGATMTIDPGVIVKLTSTRILNVDGTLVAKGTAADHIVFTSWRDSTYGGKTNESSDTHAPNPGDWRRVYINGGSAANSQLEYCDFFYGGGAYMNGTLEFNDISLTNTMKHLMAAYSGKAGIYLHNSTAIFDSVEADSNYYNGLSLRGNSSDVRVIHSTFMDNGLAGGNNNYAGLTADDGSGFREISNSTVLRNDGPGIWSNFSNIPQTFVDNTVSENGGDGIFVVMRDDAVDSLLSITGNIVENNSTEGIVSSRAIVKQNTLRGNRFAIGLTGQLSLAGTGNANGNIYGENIIENNLYDNAVALRGDEHIDGVLGGSFPDSVDSKTYAVLNDLRVDNGKNLDVNPGTIIKFQSGTRLTSYGKLTAVGTPDARVVFTSWKDDTFGGDSNEDSSSTTATPGDWEQVELRDGGSDASRISHAVIRFGAQSYSDANLYLHNTSAQVDTSYITFADSRGIETYNSTSVLYGLELHDNQTGLYVRTSNGNVPSIHQSNIYSNANYGIYNSDPGDTVDATLNYWGDATGPYHTDLNPTGQGDALSDGVRFDPWRHAQQGPLLGDVSLNGDITAFDASLVLRHSVGSLTLTGDSLTAAEVSGQNPVSAYDASLILQYVAGSIITFPALGKPIQPKALAQALSIDAASGDAGGVVEMPIQIDGDFAVTSSDIHFTCDPNLIESVSVEKSESSQDMQLYTHSQGDTMRIAIAGSQPVDLSQPIVTLVLHLKNDVKGQARSSINFLAFRVNDVDLTSRVTGVDVNVRGTPTTYNLAQNYPNPFNPTTNIQYQLPENSKVLLTVYNLRGQKVATLVNKVQSAGYYQITWNGTNQLGNQVASGVYFYRVKAESKDSDQSMTRVKKMMFLK